MKASLLRAFLVIATAWLAAAPAHADEPVPSFLEAGVIRPVNPFAELGRSLDRTLMDVRCALPDARLYGTLGSPGAEVCLSPDGAVRICLGARVPMGNLAGTTGSLFVTDRPGLCTRRPGR